MFQNLPSLSTSLQSDEDAPDQALCCRLCGSDRVFPLFTETRLGCPYTSYHCRDCDLFQTLGSVDPVSPDYIDLGVEDLDPTHRFLQAAHKLPAFRQWQSLVAKHFHKGLKKATVLDVGCGVGGFLDFARSLQMTTYGFDASEAHATEARTRHHAVRKAISMRAYLDQLASIPSIDLVTLWDVFEHIREPNSLLAEIGSQLRPTRGFLFISVPSGAVNPAKVLIATALGKPIGLIPWEHVFYYTPKSLRTVLENAGFEVVELGGVQPYVRRLLSPHEILRRCAHHILRRSSYAFQLYVLARPA